MNVEEWVDQVAALPMFIISGGSSALTTDLTLAQLHDFLPCLCQYADPSTPNVFRIPSKVSQTGVQEALRFLQVGFDGQLSDTLSHRIQIEATLAFLGVGHLSSRRVALNNSIEHTINKKKLKLSRVKEIWELRDLPFTEPHVKTLVMKLAKMNAEQPTAREMEVWRWVFAQEDLQRRVAIATKKSTRENAVLQSVKDKKGFKAMKRKAKTLGLKGKTAVERASVCGKGYS